MTLMTLLTFMTPFALLNSIVEVKECDATGDEQRTKTRQLKKVNDRNHNTQVNGGSQRV
jgi:hypothetical protein